MTVAPLSPYLDVPLRPRLEAHRPPRERTPDRRRRLLLTCSRRSQHVDILVRDLTQYSVTSAEGTVSAQRRVHGRLRAAAQRIEKRLTRGVLRPARISQNRIGIGLHVPRARIRCGDGDRVVRGASGGRGPRRGAASRRPAAGRLGLHYLVEKTLEYLPDDAADIADTGHLAVESGKRSSFAYTTATNAELRSIHVQFARKPVFSSFARRAGRYAL